MKIKTIEPLYVGRWVPMHKKCAENRPKGFGFASYTAGDELTFTAIIPYGMDKPFEISKYTEVRKLNDEEFNSMEEFYDTLEEGMFKFVFTDDAQEALFEMLIDCANIVNYGEDSFSAF